MKKRILSTILVSSMLLSLVACSESSEYLDSLQVGIDDGIISTEEAEELTVYLTENITEDTQVSIPEGEIPEGEFPEGEIPKGEIPEGEFPEGMMQGMERVEINP
ncbi:MAG: hypothetical protein R3Y24_16800, partial [Eubacteriales bacterium]